MNNSYIRILSLDLKRAFLSWKFIIGIILGAGVCYFTLLFCAPFRLDTVYHFILIHHKIQIYLAFIVANIVFSLCFYDDFKHKNVRNVIGRIGLHTYVSSKTITALLSAIFTFLLGKLLFVFLFSLKNPICLPDTVSMFSSSYLYYDLLLEQKYYLFFIMTSFHKALYCGILSQIIMLVSLIIPNKALIFSIPIAVFYVISFYINSKTGMSVYLSFSELFDGYTKIFDNDLISFLYSFGIALVSFLLLYYLTVKVIRKKVHGE